MTRNPYRVKAGAFAPLFVEAASTNDYAKVHPAPDTVYYALEQSGGRGRAGRNFLSKVGGAYFTLGFYSPLSAADSTRYPLIAGLVVAETLCAYGLQARIKWPNDVQVGGKKICGILVERRGDFVAVGIGVNVANPLDGLEEIATSLQREGASVEIGRVIEDVSNGFAAIARLSLAEILARYTPLCATLGQTLSEKSGRQIGKAIALDDEGFLLVQTPDGAIERIVNPIE